MSTPVAADSPLPVPVQAVMDLYGETPDQQPWSDFYKTEAGVWGPAVIREVALILRRLGAGPRQRLIDLGSGDGRVVLLAAALGIRALGIEGDREFHLRAWRCRRSLRSRIRLARNRLVRGDYFGRDLSRFEVVFYAGGTNREAALQEKLLTELRADARVVLYAPQIHYDGFQRLRRLREYDDLEETAIVYGRPEGP